MFFLASQRAFECFFSVRVAEGVRLAVTFDERIVLNVAVLNVAVESNNLLSRYIFSVSQQGIFALFIGEIHSIFDVTSLNLPANSKVMVQAQSVRIASRSKAFDELNSMLNFMKDDRRSNVEIIFGVNSYNVTSF